MDATSTPWCPWCLDEFSYEGKGTAEAAAEVEAGPAIIGGKVLSWRCKRCCVSLTAKKWAKALQWAARVHGIAGVEIEAEVEKAHWSET